MQHLYSTLKSEDAEALVLSAYYKDWGNLWSCGLKLESRIWDLNVVGLTLHQNTVA